MKTQIIFLGTSQAVPTAKRNHTGILLSWQNENILIDCGEGIQRQFKIAGLNPCKLTKILITHWHGDHVFGLPGLLQTLALNKYSKTLIIYGPKGTKKFMNLILKLFIFQDKLKIKVKEVSGKFVDEKDFSVFAEKMSHGTFCNAYSFVEKDKIRIKKDKLKKFGINGKLVGKIAEGKNIKWKDKTINTKDLTYKEKGRKITVIMDTRENKNIIKLAKKSDLLISEATYLDKENDLARRYGHLTAKQAGEIAKKSRSKKLIITHISQRYEYNMKLILEEAKKIFKNTILAEDFMGVEV